MILKPLPALPVSFLSGLGRAVPFLVFDLLPFLSYPLLNHRLGWTCPRPIESIWVDYVTFLICTVDALWELFFNICSWDEEDTAPKAHKERRNDDHENFSDRTDEHVVKCMHESTPQRQPAGQNHQEADNWKHLECHPGRDTHVFNGLQPFAPLLEKNA